MGNRGISWGTNSKFAWGSTLQWSNIQFTIAELIKSSSGRLQISLGAGKCKISSGSWNNASGNCFAGCVTGGCNKS